MRIAELLFQKRLFIVAALLLLAACKTPVSATTGDQGRSFKRHQLVEVLAQEINGPQNPLDTPVARWAKDLRIAIIGRDGATQDALFAEGAKPLLADFQSITGVEHSRVSEHDEPNILVVLADDLTDLQQKFEPQINQFFGNATYSKVFEKAIAALGGRCAYLAIDFDYFYSRAVIFSGFRRDDPRFADCLRPSLGGVFGLQGSLREPGSVKTRQDPAPGLTDLDREALRLLYDPTVKPGSRIGDIPALQDSI
jgi:hypothetical protein